MTWLVGAVGIEPTTFGKKGALHAIQRQPTRTNKISS
jgi:hypothetical protein